MKDLSSRYQQLFGKVEELLSKYNELKEVHKELNDELVRVKKASSKKEDDIKTLESRLSILQTAKAATHTDEERKKMQSVINVYIKEIDHCIALLNT